MKTSKLLLSASALVMSAGLASAQSITELRIGMVGGESAQDRMNDLAVCRNTPKMRWACP